MRVFAKVHTGRAGRHWCKLAFAAVATLTTLTVGASSASAATCYDWSYRLPTAQYQVQPAQYTGTTTTTQNVPQYSTPVYYNSYRTVTSTINVPAYTWQYIPTTSTTWSYQITGYNTTSSTTYTYEPVYYSIPIYSYYYWHTNYYRGGGSDFCIDYSTPVNCSSHRSGWTSHSTDRIGYVSGYNSGISYWNMVPTTTYNTTPVYGWVSSTSTTYTWEQVQSGTTPVTTSSTETQTTTSYPSAPWVVSGVSYGTPVLTGYQQIQVSSTSIVGQYVIGTNGSLSLSGSASGTKSWGAAQWVNTLPTSGSAGNEYNYSGTTQQVQNNSSTLYSVLNSATGPTATGAFGITQSNARSCVVRPT